MIIEYYKHCDMIDCHRWYIVCWDEEQFRNNEIKRYNPSECEWMVPQYNNWEC